jgi:phosphoribosylanthranilate isomerase
MTEIKVCGITNIDDARHACACGVDALGFVFHPASPRAVTPLQAREIVADLPPGVATVGVFVNADADRVRETVRFCGLDLIQLHGDESPGFCRQFDPAAVIKAVPPAAATDTAGLEQYRVRALLVDAREGSRYGGTGKTADWELAARLARRRPLILAGGLGPDNIAAALAAVRPQAVDLNSGIEAAPGRKDPVKVALLVRLIRDHASSRSDPRHRNSSRIFARPHFHT